MTNETNEPLVEEETERHATAEDEASSNEEIKAETPEPPRRNPSSRLYLPDGQVALTSGELLTKADLKNLSTFFNPRHNIQVDDGLEDVAITTENTNENVIERHQKAYGEATANPTGKLTKLQLARRVLGYGLAVPLAGITANGNRHCGNEAMKDTLSYFDVTSPTAVSVLSKISGASAGFGNLGLYTKSFVELAYFLKNVAKGNVNILSPTRLFFIVSAGFAALSPAMLNAQGEIDSVSHAQLVKSFVLTFLTNIPLFMMNIMGAYDRATLSTIQARYARALETLADKMSLLSPTIQLIKIKRAINAINGESQIYTDILTLLASIPDDEENVNEFSEDDKKSHIALLHTVTQYLFKLELAEQLEVSNAIMEELEIDLPNIPKTLALWVAYGVFGALSLAGGFYGAYFSQYDGNVALLELLFGYLDQFGIGDHSGDIAHLYTWFPAVSILSLFLNAQFYLVDQITNLPAATMRFVKSPWDIKLATLVSIAPAALLIAPVSGLCFMVDSIEYMIRELGRALLSLVVLSNYAATSVNSVAFFALTLSFVLFVTHGLVELCSSQQRHVPGHNDFSCIARTAANGVRNPALNNYANHASDSDSLREKKEKRKAAYDQLSIFCGKNKNGLAQAARRQGNYGTDNPLVEQDVPPVTAESKWKSCSIM